MVRIQLNVVNHSGSETRTSCKRITVSSSREIRSFAISLSRLIPRFHETRSHGIRETRPRASGCRLINHSKTRVVIVVQTIPGFIRDRNCVILSALRRFITKIITFRGQRVRSFLVNALRSMILQFFFFFFNRRQKKVRWTMGFMEDETDSRILLFWEKKKKKKRKELASVNEKLMQSWQSTLVFIWNTLGYTLGCES